MPRAAVLGSPISHSLSPVLHHAAYHALGLSDWQYDAIECTELGLPDLLSTMDDSWRGLSLTMPLKHAAVDAADEVSVLSAAVGAANTLVRVDQKKWRADNTDVGGIVDVLRAADIAMPADTVVIGAGGTAQAAIAALAELGMHDPIVLVRNPRRANALIQTANRLGVAPTISAINDPVVYSATLVISTVPKGAADTIANRPQWTADGVVFDVVYDPWPTSLAQSAQQAGRKVISGLDLLLYQAARQVGLMTGHDGPLAQMRAALMKAYHGSP